MDVQFGDIVVTPSSTGFLLSRIIARPAYGPWWEFVGTAADRDDALRMAESLAVAAETRVMYYDRGGFLQVPQDSDDADDEPRKAEA